MIMHGPIDPVELRSRPTTELALKLLRNLARQPSVHSNNMLRGAEQAFDRNGEPDVQLLLGRLSDAWAWLESQGMLGPDTRQSASGWQRVTARGQRIADDAALNATAVAEDRLSMALHPALESKVRPIFVGGDYEIAAFAALKSVEVRVRDLAKLEHSDLGVNLMRNAFKKGSGVLADPDADPGEQVATMELFAGAIGTFKNPASHRTVDYEDPSEAAEVVLLADLLMRLLDRVERRTFTDAST